MSTHTGKQWFLPRALLALLLLVLCLSANLVPAPVCTADNVDRPVHSQTTLEDDQSTAQLALDVSTDDDCCILCEGCICCGGGCCGHPGISPNAALTIILPSYVAPAIRTATRRHIRRPPSDLLRPPIANA